MSAHTGVHVGVCEREEGGGGDLSQVMACGEVWSLRYIDTATVCHDARGNQGSILGSIHDVGHSLRGAASQFVANGGEGKRRASQRGSRSLRLGVRAILAT